MSQKSTVTIRIPRKALVASGILIVIVVVGLVVWQLYPNLHKTQQSFTAVRSLLPMRLTIVGLNGTAITLNESNVARLESFESKGGFKTSAGSLRGIGNYTGIPIAVLCNLVGGINSSCCLQVTGSDGYSMVLTYDQAMGNGFVTFSPATGDEVNATKPLTTVLCYYMNGKNLTSDEGPLRLGILGSEGLLTEGHWWIKYVAKIEILPTIRDWTLLLKGALVENMTRATFESGVNCPTANHAVNWTDASNNVWTGIPLWLLVGRVDDGDVHVTNNTVRAFNDTLALKGYTVKVITGLGYSCEFNSTTVMRNPKIIVADRLNGAPLPEPYWPLRLVGSDVPTQEMLSDIVAIEIIFPQS
jgi:DMSO/TMAO reductase YedYZ molybdopterin-dependent catalytic subunit